MYKNKNGNTFITVITVFLFIVIASLITNNIASAESKLKIPNYTGYVNDFAGVISSENKNNLNSYLEELDKKTGAEVAVVTLSSLKGNSIEDVSLNIGRKWGVGKKGKNNGVIILVSTGDRKMRIEVGYGLEGAIPDGKAGRIRDDYMIPYFKQGNIEKGIVNGTLAVAAIIANEYKVQMPAEFNSSVSDLSSYSGRTHERKSSGSDIFVFLIFIIIFIFLSRRGIFIGGYTNYGEGFGGSSGGFGGFGGGDFGGGGASGDW